MQSKARKFNVISNKKKNKSRPYWGSIANHLMYELDILTLQPPAPLNGGHKTLKTPLVMIVHEMK